MQRTDNLNVVSMSPLPPPREMKGELPVSESAADTVYGGVGPLKTCWRGGTIAWWW